MRGTFEFSPSINLYEGDAAEEVGVTYGCSFLYIHFPSRWPENGGHESKTRNSCMRLVLEEGGGAGGRWWWEEEEQVVGEAKRVVFLDARPEGECRGGCAGV